MPDAGGATTPAPAPEAAVFVGTARDCAAFLPAALERWAELATLFRESHFLVAENDSTDATKQVLAGWARGEANRRVLTLDGLRQSAGSRPEAIAAARNALLDAVRADPRLAAARYLVVMDLDDASLAITARRLARCMRAPGWDGLFANQLFVYRDVWALRDARRSPDDFVPWLEAAPAGWRRRWARLRHLNWRARPIWPFGRPFPVRSAFGGLAVYRMDVALRGRYEGRRDGRLICEHVPFNEMLMDSGARLLLHPGLINMVQMPLYRLARRWNEKRGGSRGAAGAQAGSIRE